MRLSFLPGWSLMNSTSVQRICCASRANDDGVSAIAARTSGAKLSGDFAYACSSR